MVGWFNNKSGYGSFYLRWGLVLELIEQFSMEGETRNFNGRFDFEIQVPRVRKESTGSDFWVTRIHLIEIFGTRSYEQTKNQNFKHRSLLK